MEHTPYKLLARPSCISDEIKYMDMGEKSKLFGLKPDDVRRGNESVNILIGIDNAYLYCGVATTDGPVIM